MQKKILVINIGWEQEPLVKAAAASGAEIFAIHPNHEWNRTLPIIECAELDLRDLAGIMQYAKKVMPDAVVADQCDYAYFAAAMVSAELNLPGPTIEDAQKTTNKWIQRDVLSKKGILQPAFRLCRFLKDVELAAREIGYPVILKPVDNRGSFGVTRVDDRSTLRSAYFTALENAHSRLVLIEKFIHGIQITVDGYCFPRSGHRSLSLATKTMIGGDKQVAMEIIYPGELADAVYEKALNMNDQVVDALGLKFGMTHAEYMIDALGNSYLIEIANRGGGVFTSSTIVPAISGIDVTRQLIMDALGGQGELYKENGPADSAICLSFFKFGPGILSEISGIELVANDPRVLAFKLMANAGDVIRPIDSDGSRHGFLIAKGATRGDVLETVRELKLSIEPRYQATED